MSMLGRAAVILACAAISSVLSAQTHFSIEQVMSAPFATNPVAAPSGSRVAWVENEQGKRNIWTASAPDWKGHKATNFSEDDGQEIADLAWAPNGSYLLFARGGDFENGGENPNPDLMPTKPQQDIWSLAMDGSAPKKLTEGKAPAISPKGDLVAFLRNSQIFTMKPGGEEVKNVVTQQGTQQDLRWSPDGRLLAFVSERRQHSFIGLYDATGKSLRYLDASVDRDLRPAWSPDSKRLVYLRLPSEPSPFFSPHRRGTPWSIRVAEPDSGSTREVFRAKEGVGSVYHPIEADQQIFWAANERLVFPWELTGWCHLYSVSASGGTPVELTAGEGEVEHVSISHDGETIYFSANFTDTDRTDMDRRHLWSVGVQGQAAPKALTKGEDIDWAPAPASDGSALFFLKSTYNQRAHAMLRAADGNMRALAADIVPPEFPAASLVKPQPVMITAADGMQIHGQLFLPPNAKNGERHPALVFFHGGSRRQMLLGFHYMYYYSNAYSLNQYFANRGYIVLSANYRSGIGYGLNFREAINYGARGGSEFNDVIGAGLYLKSRSDVDPNRIGVWGGSYGGYLTAMALARASDLFAAGVDFHGVHDWSTLRGYGAPPTGGDPQVRQEQQEAARIAFDSSPMASVSTWKSPVLLIHGDDDRNVDFSQTEQLVKALRERRVPFEELIFPNEIHDFLLQRHWVQAYQAAADFFDRKLRVGTESARGQE